MTRTIARNSVAKLLRVSQLAAHFRIARSYSYFIAVRGIVAVARVS